MQPNVWNPAAAQQQQPQHFGGSGSGPPMAPAPSAFPFMADSSAYAAAAQPMLSIGANMGKAAIGHYLPFASSLWHSLRYYFDVNNSYVVNKLVLLLFPFKHRHWMRRPASENRGRHDGVRSRFLLHFFLALAATMFARHCSSQPSLPLLYTLHVSSVSV